MGIFDSINPFRKKDELALPPLDSMGGNDTFNPSSQEYGGPPSMSQPEPMDDPRMRMPLGENIRQGRMEAMYGSDDGYQPTSPGFHGPNPLQKELDLISSKLDYLKAGMEAINQRLANLEHMARQEQEKKKW